MGRDLNKIAFTATHQSNLNVIYSEEDRQLRERKKYKFLTGFRALYKIIIFIEVIRWTEFLNINSNSNQY